MQIFIDSADVKQIETWLGQGVVLWKNCSRCTRRRWLTPASEECIAMPSLLS